MGVMIVGYCIFLFHKGILYLLAGLSNLLLFTIIYAIILGIGVALFSKWEKNLPEEVLREIE